MLAFFVNSVKFEQHMSVSRSIFQSLYTSRSVKLLKLFSQQSRPSEETLQKSQISSVCIYIKSTSRSSESARASL